MANIETDNNEPQKCLQEWPIIKRKGSPSRKPVSKLKPAHIQKYTRPNGMVFYCYRRGVDKPIYLGTAETILKAVKERHKIMGNRKPIGEAL